MDRRDFLRRTGGAALAVGAAAAVPGYEALDAHAGRRLPPRLRALRNAVRGQVLLRSSRGYGRARLIYNNRYDFQRPLAIVRPANVADIQAVIAWGQRWDTRVVARSGGHSYAGYSTTTAGVVIDLQSLAGVRMTGSGSAIIGAGTQMIDIYAALSRRGLTIPAGSCPTVGIGGLAQGGGIGFASRRWGATSDNIIGLQIVTADGRVRNCDQRTNEDLFWACRGGGGGNFGVVTNFEFDTHRARSGSYFAITYPFGAASEAIDAFQRFAPEATPDLFTVCVLSGGPGGASVATFGQFLGTTARLRRTLRPLMRVPGAEISSIGSLPYLALMRRWAQCSDIPLRECHTTNEGGELPRDRFDAKSSYASRPIPAAGRAAAVRWVRRARGVPGLSSAGLIMDSYGGAINEVPADATAFAHRDELFSCQYYVSYRGNGLPSMRWVNGLWQALRPYMSGAAYVNYIDPDQPNWERAYYGSNLARLISVKRDVDPNNVFNFRQSIPLRAR